MLSLRQSLALIGKAPPTGVRALMPCRSVLDTLTAWNHIPSSLLIIAPQEFLEAVTSLAEFKRHTGMSTVLRTLEHIYCVFPGRDEAEKVKRCIALFQPSNDVRYAILVGDQNVFPVRYITSLDPPADYSAFFPVDLYYEALFKLDGSFDDWDGDEDGYFGRIPPGGSTGPVNPDHVCGMSYLAVGRIPASEESSVRTYVQKIINYETSALGAPSATRALFIATTDWSLDACKTCDAIAADYFHDFEIDRLYAPGNPCRDTGILDSGRINSFISRGQQFLVYVGHGNSDSWGIPNGYTVTDVAKLSNIAGLPIVFAAACFTGQFTALAPWSSYRDADGTDHAGVIAGEVFPSAAPQPACLQTVDSSTTMAEQFTVKQDAGAVAYIGATSASAIHTALLAPFFGTVNEAVTLGDMWLKMRQAYYDIHSPPDPETPMNVVGYDNYGYIFEGWLTNLFGDPSLRIRGIPS